MNGTAYTPRPGSKGQLAMDHLRDVPDRGWVDQTDLAFAIDCLDRNVQTNITMCLQHGLIERKVFDGHPRYRLGDGAPPEAEADETPAEIIEAEAPLRIPTFAKPLKAAPEPEPLLVGGFAPVRTAEPRRPFAAGLFSDGRLVIERGAEVFTLVKADTEALIAFLADVARVQRDAGAPA